MQKKLAKLRKKVLADGNKTRKADQLSRTVFGHMLESHACSCDAGGDCVATIRQLLRFILAEQEPKLLRQQCSTSRTSEQAHTSSSTFHEMVLAVGDEDDDLLASLPVRAKTMAAASKVSDYIFLFGMISDGLC